MERALGKGLGQGDRTAGGVIDAIEAQAHLGPADLGAPQAQPGQNPGQLAPPHQNVIGPLELDKRPEGLQLQGQSHGHRQGKGGRVG